MHHELAIIAVEEKTAITELVREALAEWLARRERPKRRRS
jgi:hypothetical protein